MMMMMMVVMLCGQRVQAVHDHGGRLVGETSLFGPAYHGTDRTRSASTHYVVLVTARRGIVWVRQDAGSVVTGTRARILAAHRRARSRMSVVSVGFESVRDLLV